MIITSDASARLGLSYPWYNGQVSLASLETVEAKRSLVQLMLDVKKQYASHRWSLLRHGVYEMILYSRITTL